MPNLTTSDIYDINRKTGALILGKNRLDDYAEKYLNQLCPEVLCYPMPVPVEQILEKAGLTVEEVQLSENLDIFGCCMLLDGEVNIYHQETQTLVPTFYPAGTILVDPLTRAFRGEGAKRNTLIHEALHWEKDKKYFEILALKNKRSEGKLYPLMCRRSETFFNPPEGVKTKENEVRWLEWQAHRLAPRVLMPKRMFKQKALELLDYGKKRESFSCDALIEELSNFFIVSRMSAKFRLLEVGLQEQLAQLEDYEAVYTDINGNDEFAELTAVEAGLLILANEDLQQWLKSRCFVFVDGYFTLAHTKYVTLESGDPHLTPTARKSLNKCVINVREHRYIDYPHLQADFSGSLLYSYEGLDTRILAFHPEAQAALQKIDEEQALKCTVDAIFDEKPWEQELLEKVCNPLTDLCECIWFLIEKQHCPTPEEFNKKTLLNKEYFGRIRRNKYNNMGEKVLMALCVAFKLKLPIIKKLFKKSNNNFNIYKEPYKTYYTIISNLPGISIDDFNEILTKRELPTLGSELIDENEKK